MRVGIWFGLKNSNAGGRSKLNARATENFQKGPRGPITMSPNIRRILRAIKGGFWFAALGFMLTRLMREPQAEALEDIFSFLFDCVSFAVVVYFAAIGFDKYLSDRKPRKPSPEAKRNEKGSKAD